MSSNIKSGEEKPRRNDFDMARIGVMMVNTQVGG